MARLRAIASRYILANELRSALAKNAGPAVSRLSGVPMPETKAQEKTIQEISRRLRDRHADAYVALADKVEGELGLAGIAGDAFGTIDTFRFQEKSVLAACFELVSNDDFAAADALIGARERGFWIDRDLARKTLWEVCRLMVQLGLAAGRTGLTVARANGDAAT